MEGGLNGTDCASIAQLSSVCLGDTADGEDVARPGVAAWLHHYLTTFSWITWE